MMRSAISGGTKNVVERHFVHATVPPPALASRFPRTEAIGEDIGAREQQDSTSYTGAIETAEEFGKRIYLEARLEPRGKEGCDG